MTRSGQTTIWYTLDGRDPRCPGGAVDTLSARRYETALTLQHSVRVRARCRTAAGAWSALSDTVYGVTPVAESLRVTELMYHPETPGTEFIEVQNTGTTPLELTGVRFTAGVTFAFEGLTLPPGAHALIVEDAAAFAQHYPEAAAWIAGEYEGRLNNGGETLTLVDAMDQIVQRFTYRDSWHPSTDGRGPSLTVKDPAAERERWNQAEGWRASTADGGTPGQAG
jgi:hypothetical protein